MDYPEVVIKMGKHTMDTPRNCKPVLQKLFYEAGYRSDLSIDVMLGPRIRATSGCPTYVVGQITPRGSLELKVKTDGNGSRHVFFIFPPKDIALPALASKLKNAVNSLYPTKEERNGGYTPLVVSLSDIIKSDKPNKHNASIQSEDHGYDDHQDQQYISKRIVGTIMADQDIVETLMETICDKAIDGQVSRKEMLDIIDSQKLGCGAVLIQNYLIRKKLIEIQGDKRGIFKINYVSSHHQPTTLKVVAKAVVVTESDIVTAAKRKAIDVTPERAATNLRAIESEVIKTMQKRSPGNPVIIEPEPPIEPTPAKQEDVITFLKTSADKYLNISKNIGAIDEKIEAFRNSIKSLEEEKEIILAGADKYKKAFDSYNQMQELLTKAKELM